MPSLICFDGPLDFIAGQESWPNFETRNFKLVKLQNLKLKIESSDKNLTNFKVKIFQIPVESLASKRISVERNSEKTVWTVTAGGTGNCKFYGRDKHEYDESLSCRQIMALFGRFGLEVATYEGLSLVLQGAFGPFWQS